MSLTVPPGPLTARALDQFYTDPTYAQHFLNIVAKHVDLNSVDILLEPSAGSGSFYNLMDPLLRVGLDLEPKAAGVVKQDFFLWNPPLLDKIVTIGNPPFGKNSSLAVKFFNRSAKYSDAIAFILPRTFRKASIINRLDEYFHCVYDETVPDNSFIFKDKPYDVWCCAQIWIKKDFKRARQEIKSLSSLSKWFELTLPDDADFAIQRVGGRAGLIRTDNFDKYSDQSHYFFKQHNPVVLDIFKKIDFNEVKFNTAGNPSISPSELATLWTDQATCNGVDLKIDTPSALFAR